MDTQRDWEQDIQVRLARLERQNRWFRAVAGVAVLAGAAALFVAAEGGGVGNFKQVDCGRLVIRDGDGQMRAWLGVAEGGARLIIFDTSGQQRMGVGMTREGAPALGIFDIGENPRMVLGMADGWPGLVFRDTQGHKRVALNSREDWTSLVFFDRTETKRTGIGQFGEAAALNLCDDRGTDRGGMTTDRKGSCLSFFDMGGRKRAGLGILADDSPALGFFTHEGLPQAGLSAVNGEPAVNLYGTNRTEVAIMIGRTNEPSIRILGSRRQVLWQTTCASTNETDHP